MQQMKLEFEVCFGINQYQDLQKNYSAAASRAFVKQKNEELRGKGASFAVRVPLCTDRPAGPFHRTIDQRRCPALHYPVIQ